MPRIEEFRIPERHRKRIYRQMPPEVIAGMAADTIRDADQYIADSKARKRQVRGACKTVQDMLNKKRGE